MLVRPGFEPATSRMLILCTLCEKIYVDETGGRFADRFREQLRDLEKKDTDASKTTCARFYSS